MKEERKIIKPKIEKNIPLPPKRNRSLETYKYPLKDMKVGDSFSIEYDRCIQQSIYGAIKYFKKEGLKAEFTISASKKDNLIRVWRVK